MADSKIDTSAWGEPEAPKAHVDASTWGEPEGEQAHELTLGQAAVKGIQNVPTFGFGDKLGALMQAGLLKGFSDDPSTFGENYDRALKENRTEDAAARDTYPIAYYGAGLPAAALSTPQATVAKGVGLGAKFINAGVNGLGQGIASGLGHDDSGNALEKFKSAGEGGLVGTAAGLIFPAATSGAGAAAERMGINTAKRAIAGAGSTISPKKAISDDSARQVIEDKVLPWVGSIKKISENLNNAVDAAGQTKGAIVDQLEAGGVTGPQRARLYKQISDQYERVKQTNQDPAVDSAYRSALKMLENKPVDEAGNLGLSQAEKMKTSQQGLVNYSNPTVSSQANEANKGIAAMMRDANENEISAQTAGDPGLQRLNEQFVPAKERYGNLASAQSIAGPAAERFQKNAGFGLKDFVAAPVIAGAVHAATGLGVPAAAAGLGYNVGRRYLTGGLARAEYGIGKSLGKVGEFLTKDPAKLGPYAGALQRVMQARGVPGLAAAHFTLSQSDPEYQKITHGDEPVE